MADNYVSLRLKATDDAKPDLTDLKARLNELSGKVATARANVDDVDADAKLTALEAKLAAVGKRVASPRIDMAGAAGAVAQITAVDAALQDMEKEPARAAERAAEKEAAASAVKQFAREGDVLLLKASRASRLERVADLLRGGPAPGKN